MCGIIGYTTKKDNAVNVTISGLKNLEYRGYDSSGIAFTTDKVNIIKSKGKIANLEEKLSKQDIKSCCAIAHTRWATHGEPSEMNAHPHRVGCVTLVHNGIIENYSQLKEELISKGYEFQTQTDTEVATAYIDYCYKQTKDKLQAIIQACKQFRGSYAFNIIFDDELQTIYATRKDSPLVIGYSHEGNFAASDVSAILNYTKQYSLIDEGEFVKINKDVVTFYNTKLQIVQKEIKTATWDAAQYQKNGYDHFMLKEIFEQPDVIQNIYNRYYDDCSYNDIDFTKFDKIHIVACGSAMHASLVGKYLLQTYAKIPVMVEIASEYRYAEELITPSTLLIVVSQSGETADTIAALRLAKEKGAYVVGIVNAVGSTISREVDKCIYTYAGPEIAVATTKGYTSQVAILSTLAINAMKQNGLLDKETEQELKNDLLNIKEKLQDVLKNKEKYLEIAKSIYNHEDLFFIGRGIDSSICMEGSLKLKEISYMHSESYSAGELKHGTISLIENDTPVIAIATNEELFEKTVSNVKETKARGAFSIFITTSAHQDYNFDEFADKVVIVPTATEFTQAILVVAALQLIAYETAKLRKCDIDKPRNLAKSVTVE